MTIEFVNDSTAVYTSSTTNVVFNKPSGVTTGDVLVSHLSKGSAGTATGPSGWTLLGEKTDASPKTHVHYRVVQAGDPSSWTWTLTNAVTASGGIAAFSGVDTTNPIDVAILFNDSTVTTNQHPGRTIVTPGTMLIGGCGIDASNHQSVTPSQMTEAFQTIGARCSAFNYELRASTGATGTRTWGTPDAGDSITWLAGLRPAAEAPEEDDLIVNDFTGGADGVTISTANSGGGPNNNTAWTSVFIGSGTTVTYENSPTLYDSVVGTFTMPTSSTNAEVIWDTAVWGTQTTWFLEWYFRADVIPSVGRNIVQVRNGTNHAIKLNFASTGKLQCRDAADVTQGTSVTTLAADTWYRLGLKVVHGTSNGIMEIKIFDPYHSSTPVETLTVSNIDVNTASTILRVGAPTSVATTSPTTWYYSRLRRSLTGYPGAWAPTTTGQGWTLRAIPMG